MQGCQNGQSPHRSGPSRKRGTPRAGSAQAALAARSLSENSRSASMPDSSACLHHDLQVGDGLLGRHVGARPQLRATLRASRPACRASRTMAAAVAATWACRWPGIFSTSRCSQRRATAQVDVQCGVCSAPLALQALPARSAQARRSLAGVLGHHFVAVGDDGFQRLAVGHRRARRPCFSCGGDLVDLGPCRSSPSRGCSPRRCRTRTA